MKKIKLDILGLSSSQSQSGSFALVLGETDGQRRLPIIIGMFEAQAIAIEVEGIIPNRPMTHDLFKSLAKNFSISVEEVIISDIKEGVFYAKIKCFDGLSRHEIDARPSDGIAIGLRFKAPIFAYEHVLNEAGIILNEEEEIEPAQPMEVVDKPSKKTSTDYKDMTTEKLMELLNEAIEKENYEGAAKIRDELNKRN